MPLFFNRSEPKVNIVIISGSCCIPGMAPFDERARSIVEQAISETGVTAKVKVIPASTGFFVGIPKEAKTKLMTDYNQSGRVGLPLVLVNGQPISYGVPEAKEIKTALLQAAGKEKNKEDNANE